MSSYSLRRVAQTLDLAGITNKWGSLSFAFFAKRGYHERIRKGLCRTDKGCVGSIAAHPCKGRKDGAPSVGVVHAKIAKGEKIRRWTAGTTRRWLRNEYGIEVCGSHPSAQDAEEWGSLCRGESKVGQRPLKNTRHGAQPADR